MESDDFIGLDASQDDHSENEAHNLQEPVSRVKESECTPILSQLTEGSFSVEDNCAFSRGGEQDDPNVLDMDLEDDSIQQEPACQASVEFVSTVAITEKVNEAEADHENDATEAINLCNGISGNNVVDESSRAKRARISSDVKQPSVRVIYNSLTRDSKRKLMELMQQWSSWQAKHQSSSNAVKDAILESGEETYYPALEIGSEKSCTVSFWIDNQARKGDINDYVQLQSDLVPLYDREYALGATSTDGLVDSERLKTLEASRCFNCGSYSHSLKECPKHRDIVAINNARKMHSSKRNQAANNHGQARYYQKAPGKFDDLKAGVLGAEARECLGIGEYDPPPWLQRMREMGYPPGYLDIVEDDDQPSEITIYADEEKEEDIEDGELPERADPESPQKKMTVGFPGINAPIPENGDHRRWGAPSAAYSGSNLFKKPTHYRSNHSSESHRGAFHDETRSGESRDDVRPGSDRLSSSFPGYSPRYSPYNHSRTERTPSFGRSISDRGQWSPVNYETSTARSTHSTSLHSSVQQSPRHHSPSLSRWDHENSYSASQGWSSWELKESHEHRHKNHHHHHHHHR